MSFGVFNVVERVERRNSNNVNKALISVLQSLKVRPAIFISWLRLILQDCLTPKLLGQLFVSFVDEHISLTKLRIFSREFL
jgi:hypothetical protein